MWIDSHCHLNADDFLNEQGQDERNMILERARQAGLKQLVVIGSGKGWSEIEAALSMVTLYQDLYAAIAVHPHDVDILDDSKESQGGILSGKQLWQKIEQLATTHPKVVAIGETGLDYFYQHAPREKQKKIFEQFLQLAQQTKKPVSLHIRDAHQDAQTIVRNFPQISGVIHCFTGTWEEAKIWMDLGFFLSFSGIVTFPKATALQETCKHVPLEKMMLETDCPYLAPIPMRGKRNEPAYLLYTADFISKLKKVSVEELASQTTKNAQTLFHLPSLI